MVAAVPDCLVENYTDLTSGLSLPGTRRPPTHGFTFAAASAAILYLVSKDQRFGWAAFTEIASHVIRDASSARAPMFWPLDEPNRIPYVLYITLEVTLLATSSCFVSRVWNASNRNH